MMELQSHHYATSNELMKWKVLETVKSTQRDTVLTSQAF